MSRNIERKAVAIIRAMGLDLSSALRLFLRQVVRTGTIPIRMESGYSAEGEKTILEAVAERDADRKTGRARAHTRAKDLSGDLDRKKWNLLPLGAATV